MRFLIDAQLPPALAQRLAALGHQADHVNNIGRGATTDADIWSHAIETGAVIVTKDEDFAMRARDPSTGGAQVVWIRLGNTTNRALWAALDPLIPETIEALDAGERLIEIA